jgi:hypothetical protein
MLLQLTALSGVAFHGSGGVLRTIILTNTDYLPGNS